jgi:hypothetical protein
MRREEKKERYLSATGLGRWILDLAPWACGSDSRGTSRSDKEVQTHDKRDKARAEPSAVVRTECGVAVGMGPPWRYT